jgi:hypothetical protein
MSDSFWNEIRPTAENPQPRRFRTINTATESIEQVPSDDDIRQFESQRRLDPSILERNDLAEWIAAALARLER